MNFKPYGIVLLSVGFLALARPGGAAETKTFLSPVYTIDKIYRSMEGPSSSQRVNLLDTATPELLWITGFRTEMVQEDGQTPSKPEFMCHVNLDLEPVSHRQALGSGEVFNSRILTLSQGQLSVAFPKGFGMPVMSNESLSLTTQVLNLNDPAVNAQVRHKVTFEFVRDRDLKKPMTPLFNVVPFVTSVIDSTAAPKDMAGVPTMHGETCLPSQDAAPASTHAQAPNAGGGSIYHDAQGRTLSGHWVVPPGRSEVRTDVTSAMRVPFDTTLHYAAAHLHPYAESLELLDVTAHKSIFKSWAHNPKDRIGLEAVDNFSSVKGVPIFKNHAYELVSVYNNPSTKNSDSMAVMLMFLRDKQFKKPAPGSAAAPAVAAAPARLPNQKVLLKTSLGNFTVDLYPSAAPQTVQQFLVLARAGVFDGAPLAYVKPGFTAQFGEAPGLLPRQYTLLKMLPLEPSRLKHRRGVLSMARNPNDPDSAIRSFCIFLGDAPHLDGRYTAFGKVVDGEENLARFDALAHDENGKPHVPGSILHIDVKDLPS